ncbi:hypothetical protein L227DRAFT_358493 [Lentinus tigrinus ALCF2SS1-6]|uniref:Uncharacterized protein n=1 Tax=Lentinus tigrinus ALCF2SS1-6 TaxID=1328759 RepID=A0A5C2SKI4_9APHY|nr:hypothetical protein L227DRAFT_358493 [Lentinus tigrinus ALCF2SS1-6]
MSSMLHIMHHVAGSQQLYIENGVGVVALYSDFHLPMSVPFWVRALQSPTPIHSPFEPLELSHPPQRYSQGVYFIDRTRTTISLLSAVDLHMVQRDSVCGRDPGSSRSSSAASYSATARRVVPRRSQGLSPSDWLLC